MWEVWQEWGPCSTTCTEVEEGIIGLRNRERGCVGDMVNDCLLLGGGESVEFGLCMTEPCPTFGEWDDWGECDVTCGQGEQSRTRPCTINLNDPGMCIAQDVQWTW